MSEHDERKLLETILRLEIVIMAFVDEANTKLKALEDAIAAIPAPIAVDPATIVPVADQQTVLNGIDAATAAATAKASA